MSVRAHRVLTLGALLGIVSSAPGVLAQSGTPDQLQQLRQEIETQRKAVEGQQRILEDLMRRLEALERDRGAASSSAAAQVPTAEAPGTSAAAAPRPTGVRRVRDSVGDLNAAQVATGKIPGGVTVGEEDTSINIGGFVKTVAYHDTNAEDAGPIFFPSQLGSGRDDIDGASSVSAQLTRLSFDARTKFGNMPLRGYVEFDFSGDRLTWRHGYLSIEDRWGKILAGKYWSNFMDIRILPEGLSEPTLSGAIFARQAQIRYSRDFSSGVQWSVSIEDPNSNDVLARSPIQTRTAWPDLATAVSLTGERGHFQIAGLLRRISIDPDDRGDFGVTGWGLQASGTVKLGAKDKWGGSVVYGKGFGRYLLGLEPTSGAFVDPEARKIVTRNAVGALSHVRHQWTSSCRSTVGAGYAAVATIPDQPADSLRSSFYGIANLLCTVNNYITLGGEYGYGRRWNKEGSLGNNRFMFGIQLF